MIVLPKGQIFRWREDRTVTRRAGEMSRWRTKNNYRYKRDEIGYRASYSRYVQEISKIVKQKRRVEFQSDHSVYGMY